MRRSSASLHSAKDDREKERPRMTGEHNSVFSLQNNGKFFFKKLLDKNDIFANLDLSKMKRLARGVETSLYALMQNVNFASPVIISI